ncbi:RND transporter [Luteitalea sp. TBR-22]|uniref:efflux RND transporter periplasmic adaptor subunit n=1 Tax=Luteitalea sp. TBR-22 TaxID=2802971 RepID=UPI001AF1C0B7|nr:efflux RND transporter periplasmic adaptor subunit [Luteitalea sp. TBR-22]BCS34572.1 RND transporter [Luteitalea sp. TBR-22]
MKRSTKRWLGAAVVLAIVAGLAYANFAYRKKTGKEVTVEAIQTRDLVQIVSASGKIQAKRTVNISADNMGRVTQLSVEEGDRVKKGQFLMQIDPRNLASAVQSGEAGQQAARSQLEQQRLAIVTARENLALAREELKRQEELWAQQLTTKQALDQARNTVTVREAELRQREQDIRTQEQRIRQEGATLNQAQYNLSRARIESPIDGIVSRRNIEEGETVVIGTMNNAGTVLLTIADMSIIEAEVEVDETDIPSVRLGQVAKVTIDALPGKEYTGKVTEIGNSPIQATGAQASSAGQAATNFKVTIQLDTTIDEVRPGFTCSAEIETAKRSQAVAVPIQAMAVRDMVYDKSGAIVRPPKKDPKSKAPTPATPAELPPGQTRKETEGVFVMRDKNAEFVPVRTGIAGERYFEVLSGVKVGDKVITGPFNSVRDLQDGDEVRLAESDAAKKK